MIIDGRAIAEDLYKDLSARRSRLPHAPRLGIIVAGHNPVIESFVGIKTRAAQRLGIEMRREDADATVTTEEAIALVQKLSPEVDAIIVQLPLPKTADVNGVLSAIPDNKDVDALSTASQEHLVEAPVARAVVEILERSNVDPKGKRAVIIGAGRLVGAPTAALLKKLGADVSLFTLEEGSIEDLKTADIVLCGAGNPGFVKPEHLKKGVALIDAGASEQGGKVVGDCDPACAEVASVFTPVPGGVGPVAVAMIFENLFDLMEKRN
ncbi:MAG TPA: bifunctional 5,10-methylenetetrahydrofolate dehydrogenase/5,10-methenyltetrahydrofolate cyclohydrolase [Candidatus Paceibacterota bacterium]|nr:bifunctional 5,10-methylenetetrahydrofolate dehydrogenase/5,10-methenyltetrahydrofolate cyclohydrolase [Candidatus Paceibacterota bacterium]